MTDRRRYVPGDADGMLRDPERLAWACDLAQNPAFRSADARSRALDGQRLVDAYKTRSQDEWKLTLQHHVSSSIGVFQTLVPSILVKTINAGQHHWGPETDKVWDDGFERTALKTPKARDIAVPCAYTRMLHNLC